MAKTIKNDRVVTWEIDGDSKTWTLEEQASIAVIGEPAINVLAGSTGNLLKLYGEIAVSGDAGSGVLVSGDSTKIVVGEDAVIEAERGIVGQASQMRVVNRGDIHGTTEGITSISAINVRNFGEIIADDGIATLGSSRIVNGEGGVIHGYDHGVVMGFGPNAVLINHGEISGDFLAVRMLNGGENRLVNTGSITGDIKFGKGDDLLDSRKGTIDGDVTGGLGDDVYKLGKNDILVIEGNDEGYDTIYSRVSHMLEANIEDLYLTGKQGSSGFGNDGGNHIHGSLGNDTLGGGGGDDAILSGRGNDVMMGDAGEDIFIFYPGYGKDEILDFTQGEDLIALNDKTDGMYFHEIQPRMSQHGADVWIRLGHGDRVIVANTDLNSLTVDDFT